MLFEVCSIPSEGGGIFNEMEIFATDCLVSIEASFTRWPNEGEDGPRALEGHWDFNTYLLYFGKNNPQLSPSSEFFLLWKVVCHFFTGISTSKRAVIPRFVGCHIALCINFCVPAERCCWLGLTVANVKTRTTFQTTSSPCSFVDQILYNLWKPCYSYNSIKSLIVPRLSLLFCNFEREHDQSQNSSLTGNSHDMKLYIA